MDAVAANGEPLPLGTVVGVALQSCLKILLMCTVGVVLRRQGLFSESLQKGVTTLVVLVFTPALLFTNVAASISADVILSWWPLPVFAALYLLIGLGLALAITAAFRLPPAKRNWVMVALAFRNTTSIPLALVAQLAYTLTILRSGPDDTGALAAQRGEAYILFYTALISTVRWTLGERLMRSTHGDDGGGNTQSAPASAGPPPAARVAGGSHGDGRSHEALVPPPPPPPPPGSLDVNMTVDVPPPTVVRRLLVRPSWRDRELSELMMLSVVPALGHAVVSTDANQRARAGSDASLAVFSGTDDLTASDSAGQPETALLTAGTYPDTSHSREAAEHLGTTDAAGDRATAATNSRQRRRARLRSWWNAFRQSMHPPLVATLLALFVGLIPALQGLFFGTDAPLALTVTAALDGFGQCAIPSILLVMGAQLAHPPDYSAPRRSAVDDPSDRDPRKAIDYISYGLYAAVMLCALVVSAIIGGALVEGMVWAAPKSLLAHDPVLQFTLMVESAVPSAINMLTLASMNDHFVSATSRLLFYSYIASAVTVPAAAVTYVVLLDK